MMTDDLKELWDRASQAAWARGWIVGRLGKLEENGAYRIRVPGKPGRVYFRPGATGEQGVTEAINMGAAEMPNAPVRARLEGGHYLLYGTDPRTIYQYTGGTGVSASAGPHAKSHVWSSDTEPGSDKLPVFQPALQMLKTSPNGDLTVTVNGLIWGDGNRFLGTNSFSLAPYVPEAATVPVLVYLDTNFNTIAAVEGTYELDGNIFEPATVQFPDVPPQAIPSAFVMLSAGQTAITWEHVHDARAVLDVIGREEHPLALAAPATLVIDEGEITATGDFHLVEAGEGETDDLYFINAAKAYQLLLLRAAPGHSITVRHDDENGNVSLNGETDFVLEDEKSLLLVASGGRWTDVGGAWGSGGGSGDVSLLFTQVLDQTVADTTDETTLVGPGRGNAAVGADLLTLGAALRIRLRGHVSTTGTPTLSVRLLLGGDEVCATGAEALNADLDGAAFALDALITCRSTGATGTVVASGLFEYDGALLGMVKDTTTTVDTTAALPVAVTATWGAADEDNSITTQLMTIELLTPPDGLAPVAPSSLTAVVL